MMSASGRGLRFSLAKIFGLLVAILAMAFVGGSLTGVRNALAEQSAAASTDPQDFQAYRTKVEPIFLKKRAEHARCYSCHSHNESLFHLQTLQPGQVSFTEEQSRMNFQSVMELVTPGDLSRSRLLLHPLAP